MVWRPLVAFLLTVMIGLGALYLTQSGSRAPAGGRSGATLTVTLSIPGMH